MNWKKTSLALSALLAVSLIVHLLCFSGCFGGNDLIREKNELLDRFQNRITELEEENRAFKKSLTELEIRIKRFSDAHNQVKNELLRIMEEYRALPQALPENGGE